MARSAVGWGVRELALAAKVSPNTVVRLERGEVLHERTLNAIQRALEDAGVEFIPVGTYAGDGGVGVRLRKAE